MIAPISDQNTTPLTVSADTPQRGAMRPSSHAPTRNPIAMKSPCGEIANESPNRMRSRTGQPMARIEGSTDAESIGGAGIGPLPSWARPHRERGHSAATARPSRNPLATSEG